MNQGVGDNRTACVLARNQLKDGLQTLYDAGFQLWYRPLRI